MNDIHFQVGWSKFTSGIGDLDMPPHGRNYWRSTLTVQPFGRDLQSPGACVKAISTDCTPSNDRPASRSS